MCENVGTRSHRNKIKKTIGCSVSFTVATGVEIKLRKIVFCCIIEKRLKLKKIDKKMSQLIGYLIGVDFPRVCSR
jgi:hypothetical protein